MSEPEWLTANRLWWDERAGLHPTTEFYGQSIALRPSWIVDELGSIDGLDVVHLQCHFGKDTLALLDLGARSAVGLDFSPVAIETARRLAAERGHAAVAEFVCAEFHDAPAALGRRTFDLVFTGMGAICWLPKISEWARIVAGLLRPGGRLYVAEFHPVLWGFDGDGTLKYRYLEGDPVRTEESGTYADRKAATVHNVEYGFAHGLGEIVTAVIDAGLQLEFLHEQTDCVIQMMDTLVEVEPGAWRLPQGELPMHFSLAARSPA